MPSAGYGWLLAQMVLVLLAVCLLAYALLRFGMRRFQAAASRTRGMRVVARLVLEPRRSIYVVEIAGRHLVVGAAENGLTQLLELDADTVARLQQALAQESPRTSFKDILAKKR